jgi:lipoprotein-anchoring transpeptidase ErfK/SrfK
MTLPHRLSGIVLATLVMAGGLVSATSAQAEDLVDFLWGGSDEYGGGRKIVSFDRSYKPNQIIVSFSDRRIYLITKPGEAITYPVAVPKGDARWQGVTFVSSKRVNPSWTPTPDMLRENPRLPHWVPGGHPMNPLGIRAMYLGSSAYRIHGTDAPWTIGQAVSHGCIRMTNKDVLDLYPRVPVGMRVTVTWQHFSTGSVASGDSYPRYGNDNGNSKTASEDGPSEKRSASSSPTDGSLSSLFFWNEDDKPVPASSTASSSDKSEHAVEKPAAPAQKKSASSATKKKSVSEEKKASSEEKKPASPASEEKKSASASAPTPVHTSVPDPKKPRDAAPVDPVATKASLVRRTEMAPMPAATKTTASADDSLPVHRTAEQIQ